MSQKQEKNGGSGLVMSTCEHMSYVVLHREIFYQ